MTTPRKTSAKWRPGESGNPAGRPRGSWNQSTRLRKMINAEAIVRTLAAAAAAGDVAAARTLLERALPALRSTREMVVVEGIDPAATASQTAQAIVCAAAAGQVPADVAVELVTAMAGVARLREVDELSARIEALEKGSTCN